MQSVLMVCWQRLHERQSLQGSACAMDDEIPRAAEQAICWSPCTIVRGQHTRVVWLRVDL